MFKKFNEKESVSGMQQLKSSVQKEIRKKLLELYPSIEPYMDQILPKKEPFRLLKCHDRVEILIGPNGDLLFFKSRDGSFIPTLRLLHQYPFLLPWQQVDKGAIRFVLSGANVMCPGLTSKGAKLTPDIEKKSVVAIMAEGKQHAMAIEHCSSRADDQRCSISEANVDEEPFSESEDELAERAKHRISLPVPKRRIRTLSGTIPPVGYSPIWGGPTMCLMCLEFFDLPKDTSLYARHLLKLHKIVITEMDLICLYCEEYFADNRALMEHMRIMQHREVNPKNVLYDKFYVINYLELGKKWLEVLAEDFEDTLATFADSDEEAEEESWNEWEEEDVEDEQTYVCLLCDKSFQEVPLLLQHMLKQHHFHFSEFLENERMDFYERIKFVNFIRKKCHDFVCFICGKDDLRSSDALKKHLSEKSEEQMKQLPGREKWNKEEYLQPTYENDLLLTVLDEIGGFVDGPVEEVHPEDLPDIYDSILNDPEIKEDLQ
ncbi:Malignant T-cell-amplified sequence 1 [Trichinella pseudospiralis]|uniref:Malignant T-cell-amplified sequence 1 n=1 Tax=Trichinella pseudospiralis TaxID=6337 RepID=A0A0V0XH60_TRIPS|nr:Malignant T-cell-amplified sequence 1 [Trichinella pseudospiralis]